MKFALGFLALVAVASARIELPNFGRGELYKDIQEFLDLLPQDEIVAITMQYYTQDAEFQSMVQYFLSPEFKALIKDVEALPEVKVLMDYIHNAGIDIYKIMNMLNDLLGLGHLTPPSNFAYAKITGGIRGYLDDIEAIIPADKLNALYESKLKSSPEFAKFVEQLKSENFQTIVNKVYVHPTFQKLLKSAEKVGIDLNRIKELLKTLWGIDIPSRPGRFFIKY